MATKTSEGILDPRSLSDDELKSWAAQNSGAWHTDPANRSRYEAENKAIMALLDERNGTTSTLDTTTGKWSTTGGSSSVSSGTVPVQQPQQQAGYYTQADIDAAVATALKQQKEQSEYDLSEYIKEQQAKELESQLAGLKGAYDQSLIELKNAKDKLPGTYEDARNAAAAQDALARRSFLEGAAYQGLGSGAAGQAELTRGATLTGTLSQIDRAQADSLAELDLQEATLANQYQQAIQQAKANGDSALATALYQELVRLQGIEREDKQLAQIQEQLAYNQQQAEKDTFYNREQAEREAAQERINTYLAAFGKVSDLDESLISQSGYTTGELTALEQYYAQQAGVGKPTLTASDVDRAIRAGNLTPNVLSAYEYYYGIPYSSSGVSSGVNAMGGVYSGGGPKYDNGSLTTKQVKALQIFLNDRDELELPTDGFWDANSQSATGMSADEAWQRTQERLLAELIALRSKGAEVAEINDILVEAKSMGLIDAAQESELRSAYVGSVR